MPRPFVTSESRPVARPIDRTAVDRALRAYRRQHRFIERYDRLARQEARALPPNRIQRAVRRAAVVDDSTRRRLGLFGMRAAPVSHLLNPWAIVRAAVTARRSATRAADAAPARVT